MTGPEGHSDAEPQLVLRLEGFEGPLELLLELARGQKVDLAGISILSLVEQFLAVVEGARRVRLELAADWLVMAAWLLWLKSRLLLPAGDAAAEEEAEAAAGALAARLEALEHVQAAARWLAGRPKLGVDVFARGAPERLVAVDRSGLSADVAGLMRGYLAAAKRGGPRGHVARRAPMWSVGEAMARLERMLGGAGAGWTALERLVPAVRGDAVQRRGALASTLLAGLELARRNEAELRQDAPFGPILLRAGGQRAGDGR